MAALRLIPFSRDNARLVLGWRNQPRVRGNMLTDSEITLDHHLAFLERLASDASRVYFLVYLDELPVATLYFTGLGGPEVTWGCYIGTEKLVPGLFMVLFLMASDMAFERPETVALYSEVAEYNAAPIRFNRFVGLPVVERHVRQTDSGKNVLFWGYRLDRDSLASVRGRTLKVTPAAMRQAYSDWKMDT